jgi:hypothetical protein
MNVTEKLRIGVLLTILIVSLSVPTFLVSANRGYESNVSMQVPPSEEVITTGYSQDGSSPEPFVHTIGSLKTELVKGPSHNSPIVYVVVNSTLWSLGGTGLQDRISRYHDDMEATGFSVYTWILWTGNPETIRSWFAGVTDLVGCVLVGDIPSAWYQMFHVPPIWDNTTYEQFPIDLFYMDLDGAWFDEKVKPYPGFAGTDGIYDVHNASTGDVDPEIWIGRIKADDMADPEVGLVTNYFDKNHDYRTGSLSLPQRALVYVDDDWAPGTTLHTAVQEAYPSSTLVSDKNTTKKADYVDRLEDQWSWVHVKCHGNPGGHIFKILNATGHSVGESVWMTWNDYRTGDYPVFFYNLFVCSGERFTSTNYLGGWVIFTPTYGLAAVGSTKTGGMQNDFDLYDPLGDGDTLGEAFKDWFTSTAETSRPWYYGMTISGDPTLRVSGKHLMTINTIGLAGATGVVHYTENGVAKTGNIAGGSWSDYCDHGTTLSIDGAVTISSNERYSTTDTHSWSVAEPRTFTVNYYHQYKPTITTSGLPASATATVTYVQNGVTKTKTGIWDSNPFNEWCDAGSTVSISNPVIVSSGERYYSTGTTSWTVSSAFSATVTYYHQFKVTCSVTTAGTGHEDLTVINHVTVDYTQSGSSMSENIYDSHDLTDWMDYASTYTFENPSSASTATHRWYTPQPTAYSVTSSTTTSLTYYEQFKMTISSSGGLLTSTYHGTTNYLKFAILRTGSYWEGSPWSDWCDIGSTLTASQIVLGPPNERYHTPGTVSWTVTASVSYNLPYHKEYKITVKAEGLPDTLSTTVTIGTADPSPSDDVAGGDINNYVLTLDSSSAPPFTWTNWVHADTDMTTLSLITVSPSEKYILLYWTRDGLRFAPPTVYAEVAGLTYSAQYAGMKKQMSLDEVQICNSTTVTIDISNPPAGTTDDKVYVIDDLPNELSFVKNSAEIDGAAYTPTVTHEPSPELHERLAFEVSGTGKHTITFEAKVNRAYATDTTVENHVGVTFDLTDVGELSVDVLFEVTIHPYIGPTLSKAADGPETVPLFTKESWVFTYIVKNNHDYEMAGPSLKDNFGAELIYDLDTLIANLLTEWEFTTQNGRSEKVSLYWNLPNLAPGEAYKLQVTMSTGKTPSKQAQQEYTSPGVKILNSGATLKWLNDANKKQSLETEPIYVTAVGQIYGYVRDQHSVGVEGVTIELYYDGELIETTQTDSSGQYNFAHELKDSGVYTIKIKELPEHYDYGIDPSEKTATYNAGQPEATEVNFEITESA